jgi:protocatechuate 3,4-dioxygenase beta subunit
MLGALTVFLVATLTQAAAPAATGGISGRVTADGTNAPVAGARVMIFPAGRPPAGPSGPPPQATTDQDGRFVFDRLAPGDYRLDVQKTGFAPLAVPMTPPRLFTVTAGQMATADLQLQRGAVIAGRVTDTTGQPITDARMMALRRAPAPPRAPAGNPRFLPAPVQGPQQTNDLGEFRISGLAPGEYIVAAMPRAFSAFGGPAATLRPSNGAQRTTTVTTYFPGTIDQAGAQIVSVTAGAEVANITFVMQSAPAFRVSGVVVDEGGAPVEGAMVMLMNDPRVGGVVGGPIGNGQSDARGRFAIDDVPAGTYRVNASVIMRMSAGLTGGVTGGVSTSFSVGPTNGGEAPPEVVVTDGDVSGVRVVARRPPGQ